MRRKLARLLRRMADYLEPEWIEVPDWLSPNTIPREAGNTLFIPRCEPFDSLFLPDPSLTTERAAKLERWLTDEYEKVEPE